MSKRLLMTACLMALATSWLLLSGCKVDTKSAAAKKEDIAKKKDETGVVKKDDGKKKGAADDPIIVGPISNGGPTPRPVDTELFELFAKQMKHEIDANNTKLDEKERKKAQDLAREAEAQRSVIYLQVANKEKKK